MSTLKEAISSLEGLNREDLLALNQEVVRRIKNLNRTANMIASYSVSPGDRVTFNGRGEEIYGVVVKCNPSRAIIETKLGNWKVPYASLKKIEA